MVATDNSYWQPLVKIVCYWQPLVKNKWVLAATGQKIMGIGSHWLKDNGYWQSLVKKQWVLAANDCQYTGQDKLAL